MFQKLMSLSEFIDYSGIDKATLYELIENNKGQPIQWKIYTFEVVYLEAQGEPMIRIISRIFNATSSEIRLYDTNDLQLVDGVWIVNGAQPKTIIPPGRNIAAKWRDPEPLDPVDGIPIFRDRRPVSIGELPPGYDFYIVTLSYRDAAQFLGRYRDQLLTPYAPVFELQGREQRYVRVGYVGLALW